MRRTLLTLACASVLATPALSVLSLKITSPNDQSFTLMPNQSASVYGTITGVEGSISSWSFAASASGGAPVGATFTIANDGTMGTMGYYIAHNGNSDFSGLLGMITATGTQGRSYTDVLTVFDQNSEQQDGENLGVRIASVQPTPEPSALAALGIGGLSMLRRRRSLPKAGK